MPLSRSDEEVLAEAKRFIAREQRAWWDDIMAQEVRKMLYGDSPAAAPEAER